MFEIKIKTNFKLDKTDYCPSHFCIPYSLKGLTCQPWGNDSCWCREYITDKEVTFTD